MPADSEISGAAASADLNGPEEETSCRFPATQWSVIIRARHENEPTEALNWIFTAYREPLLYYLRTRGFHRDAEDILHGFFEKLLKRGFPRGVKENGGRFRSLLMVSLNNYLKDLRDRCSAKRRCPGEECLSLDLTDDEGNSKLSPHSTDPNAAAEFDRVWARTIIDISLQRIQKECQQSGNEQFYQILEPVLYGDDDGLSYRNIGKQVKLSESAVRTAAYRLRERIRVVICEEIQRTVNGNDWRSECDYLLGLLRQE